jgi:hypothetical protein
MTAPADRTLPGQPAQEHAGMPRLRRQLAGGLA